MRQSPLLKTRYHAEEGLFRAARAELGRAASSEERIAIVARLILREFDAYYFWSRLVPDMARQAFEERDWTTSVELSRDRLAAYSVAVGKLAPRIAGTCPAITSEPASWAELERHYLKLIEGRYEADLALAFLHSLRRILYQDEWQPVDYSFAGADGAAAPPLDSLLQEFPGGASITSGVMSEILRLPAFTSRWRGLRADARLSAERINQRLGLDGGDPEAIESVQMIDAGFYRNRGAYLLGRIRLGGGGCQVPLAIALLNETDGIFADAVITDENEIHALFSSTLANFHVTQPAYHELSRFLHAIMPKRPLGLHYSTIGFNHVGKVAVMDELAGEISASGEKLGTAVGFPGTVAIGFSAPSSNYVLKVIRDRPTKDYKWGTFGGVEQVLSKYRIVHDINRTGSMLDNIIYTNLKLDRAWFDPALLDEILAQAGNAVSLRNRDVIFKHLIVQLKMIPLPVFLETASRGDAERAVINLGYCIKNNTAANIFNKDLDGRNYGVSRILKVYLFDYDAVERFDEIKIRTNTGRFDGEEEVPDWVFEDGVVFLPEEIEAGLRIDSRPLRRLFRSVHGDLLTVGYWERIQAALSEGRVPRIRTYPDERKLVTN